MTQKEHDTLREALSTASTDYLFMQESCHPISREHWAKKQERMDKALYILEGVRGREGGVGIFYSIEELAAMQQAEDDLNMD